MSFESDPSNLPRMHMDEVLSLDAHAFLQEHTAFVFYTLKDLRYQFGIFFPDTSFIVADNWWRVATTRVSDGRTLLYPYHERGTESFRAIVYEFYGKSKLHMPSEKLDHIFSRGVTIFHRAFTDDPEMTHEHLDEVHRVYEWGAIGEIIDLKTYLIWGYW